MKSPFTSSEENAIAFLHSIHLSANAIAKRLSLDAEEVAAFLAAENLPKPVKVIKKKFSADIKKPPLPTPSASPIRPKAQYSNHRPYDY